MLLDACTTFCTTLTTTVGPTIANYVCIALVAGLAWWNARKSKAANVQLTAKVAEAHVQLAEIKGSLRPAAMVLGTSSSQSGNFEPVVMPELGAGVPRPRPSMPDPSVSEPRFPPPARMPGGTTFVDESELDTKPATPSAKKAGQ
ncbi:MAG: hypothetical protein H0X39_00415 [Actinobacteria bacterium]|nr:hypothetical protein [Actinomycetota bacterium]